MRLYTAAVSIVTAVILLAALTFAQQQNQAEQKPGTDRLLAARTVFLKHASGSEIPFNVISSTFEGWGRFTVVDSPEKADIVLEVFSPPNDTDIAVGSPIRDFPEQRRPTDQPSPTARNRAADPVRLTIYDAKTYGLKTKLPLWSAAHHPKYAMRAKARESSLVEATEALIARLRDRVEPPAKPSQ
ncbi:MAG TPA: hypothetical protein VKT33_12495 [Candidatus Angelobacter sp.]|nr:hypothetical protein [Candidatus Angelobacter sp.]